MYFSKTSVFTKQLHCAPSQGISDAWRSNGYTATNNTMTSTDFNLIRFANLRDIHTGNTLLRYLPKQFIVEQYNFPAFWLSELVVTCHYYKYASWAFTLFPASICICQFTYINPTHLTISSSLVCCKDIDINCFENSLQHHCLHRIFWINRRSSRHIFPVILGKWLLRGCLTHTRTNPNSIFLHLYVYVFKMILCLFDFNTSLNLSPLHRLVFQN